MPTQDVVVLARDRRSRKLGALSQSPKSSHASRAVDVVAIGALRGVSTGLRSVSRTARLERFRQSAGRGCPALTERRAPNRPAQRRLGGRVYPDAAVRQVSRPTSANPADLAVESRADCTWGVEDPFMRTGCFPRGARIAQRPLAQDLRHVNTASVLAVLRPAASLVRPDRPRYSSE